MGVLQRDIEAYQSAVDRYNQQARAYRKDANAYNSTLVMDGSGNRYVRDQNGSVYTVNAAGQLTDGAQLPYARSLADYGSTAIDGESNYRLVRQNPTERRIEFQNAQASWGEGGYLNGYTVDGYSTLNPNEWQKVEVAGDNLYRMQRDTSTYAAQPGEFTAKQPTNRPDPSMVQIRKMSGPGVLDQERGLIANVALERMS